MTQIIGNGPPLPETARAAGSCPLYDSWKNGGMGNPRVDQVGRAYKGSQRQVQTWVNDYADDLNRAIIASLPDLAAAMPEITWRSPLRSENHREYADEAFLKRIGLGALADKLSEFWPSGGPVWDGLATYRAAGGATGVILVEGKSYPGELEGSGCQAGKSGSEASRRSRIKIANALRRTQTWLEMADIPDWMGPLYQSANRLAYVYWLREEAKVDAWLVHLLFADDPIRNTSRERWESELPKLDQRLGLAQRLPWHANVIVDAKP
jgi:hypothetical protein